MRLPAEYADTHLNTVLHTSSTFRIRMKATSPASAGSITYLRSLKTFVSFFLPGMATQLFIPPLLWRMGIDPYSTTADAPVGV